MKKSSRIITITLGIICIMLTATIMGAIFHYNSTINAKELTIDTLQNQIEAYKNTTYYLNLQIDNLLNQLTANQQTIDKLQNQTSTNQQTIDDLLNQLSVYQQTIVELQNQLAASNQTIVELQNQLAASNQTIVELQEELAVSQQANVELQDNLMTATQEIDLLTVENTKLEDQKDKLEQVITFNTSNLETLVFHVCKKDWIDIPDVSYIYNEILSLNNNTYNIILLPEFEEHQNWTSELEWLNNNFMGKQGIPIMLETFAGSEGNSSITKLSPENITTALTACNIKYLRFAEVISWHIEHNVTFPTAYVESMLDFCRTNNLKIFWTEWKTDYLPITEVFSQIQPLIEGYEDVVTVSFSTNSGETEPALGFLKLDEIFQHCGASIQAWYWDTRYNEPLLNMPISLLVQHALAAKNVGAEIIQFEPYWYFFNSENGEITERLEVLFTMLK